MKILWFHERVDISAKTKTFCMMCLSKVVICVLHTFSVCLRAQCAPSACLRHFGGLRRNTLLEFWSMYVVYVVNLCYFGLGGPTQHASSASVTSERTRPWIFGICTLCVLQICVACWCLECNCHDFYPFYHSTVVSLAGRGR